MNPFDAIGNFVLGAIKNNQFQQLLKLVVSVVLTMVVTFPFVLGTIMGACLVNGAGGLHAFAVGFATACSVTPIPVIRLWQTNPATKGIPLAWTEEEEKAVEKTAVAIDLNKK